MGPGRRRPRCSHPGRIRHIGSQYQPVRQGRIRHHHRGNCWAAPGVRSVHEHSPHNLMARPNKDRVMVSFYVSRTGKQAVDDLADNLGQSKADTYRELLRLGLQHHKPSERKP